jgi:hypothetical protein
LSTDNYSTVFFRLNTQLSIHAETILMEFKLPSRLRNEQGDIRKAGFELEFGGVSLESVAESVIELYGGQLEVINKYNQQVNGTTLGDFTLKLDLRLMNEKHYHKLFDTLGIPIADIHLGKRSLEEIIENVLESALTVSVPNEISVPPVSLLALPEVEKLRLALHQKQARGTKSSIFYTFATHINPELPALDITTLLNYTRAFLLLYPWLFKVSEIDFTRRLTSYINPFPAAYFRLVLLPFYQPTLEQFINDYHQHNPDRNRPLDLYPAFAWLAPEAFGQLSGVNYVKPRPTFHYRLPNSMIDDPAWSIATEWNRWYEVEVLANQPEKLTELSQAYLLMESSGQAGFEQAWLNHLEEWMNGEKEKTQNRGYGA